MKAPAPVPLVATVLAFDFDGTLHDPAGQQPVPAGFFQLIQQLRRDQAMAWGINTGRSLPHLVDGFAESRFPILPDWVVAREREIYFHSPGGRWLPHDAWNRSCEQQIHGLFKRLRRLLDSIRHLVEQSTGAQWLAMDGEPAGIISRTEEEMEWIVGKLAVLTRDEPLLGWQRNSVYLRFGHRDFQKGSSLSAVARHYSLGPANCFAIGDSHNDLEMLDPRHAQMAACPGNALAEVKEHVTSSGGYVAQAVHGAGVIEALRHFFPAQSNIQ
ncbi:MAG: HAD hydrolase family protein [Verrucomicrobiota bacterium]